MLALGPVLALTLALEPPLGSAPKLLLGLSLAPPAQKPDCCVAAAAQEV